MPQLSKLVMATCVAAASAQWGRKNKQQAAAPGSMGSMGDMGDLDGLPERNDVDRAMAGWEQLSQNPGKMKEVMESFKDPEVMAKAQEMLKDPQYMAAAKKKARAPAPPPRRGPPPRPSPHPPCPQMEQLKAKAQANGMLDENGQPTAGFAGGDFEQAAQMMKAMGGPGAGAGGGAQAREWELDNVARHAAGEIDDAELGMANLKNAMKDPSVMGEMMQACYEDLLRRDRLTPGPLPPDSGRVEAVHVPARPAHLTHPAPPLLR